MVDPITVGTPGTALGGPLKIGSFSTSLTQRIEVKGLNRGQVEDHDCKSIVLSKRQDPSHFAFSIWYALLFLAYGLDALCQHKK
jgi:hypothetical protein